MMNIVIELINAGLNTMLAYMFFKTFLDKKPTKWRTFALFAASFAILSLSMLFFKGSPVSYLLLFASNFVLCFCFKSKPTHKIIYTIIAIALMFAVEMIIGIGITAVFNVSIEEAKTGNFYVLGIIFSKLLLYFTICIIKFFKHKPLIAAHNKRYFLIIAFPISSAFVLFLQHSILLNSQQSTVMYYMVVFSDFALLLANFVVFDYIDSLYDNAIQKTKAMHANKMIELQAQQYKSLVESNYKLNKTRHDFKNFCIGIISELEKGKTESVIKKLNDMYEEFAPTENGSADIFEILIHMKQEEAARKGVELVYRASNIPKLKFNDTDLSVLLGNAIDNAIEAAEKVSGHKKVEVFLTFNNDLTVIRIKNPVVKDLDVNNLNTTKEDAENHGFGIIGMRQIVKKYDGELVFSCKDLCFTTSIVMNNLPTALIK